MFKMINPVKEYAWGSRDAFSELFGWAASRTPQAEIWMGAHQGSPSSVVTGDEEITALNALLAERPEYLGTASDSTAATTQLPFLLKILAASSPLSIQAHPTREHAEAGYAAETRGDIPLDAPDRNYRDVNHKPEMIIALTEFSALCGFRPHAEAIAELRELRDCVAGAFATGTTATVSTESTSILERVIDALLNHLDADDYAAALDLVLHSEQRQASLAARDLREAMETPGFSAMANRRLPQLVDTLRRITPAFPNDPGLFVALLLNRVDLHAGQALFLPTGNLHAYLHGVGVEVMANSDNVLRGGLTAKHIDVPELLAVAETDVLPLPLCIPTDLGPGHVLYRPPVEDFQLECVTFPTAGPQVLVKHLEAAIVVCTAGALTVSTGTSSLTLSAGESAFLTGNRDHFISSASAQAFIATSQTMYRKQNAL